MVDMNIEQARHNMIEQQIRTWEVLDQRVLDLILRIPREDYVPHRYRNLAFSDMEIPLGHGEVMMPPKLEGRVLQALDVQPDDKVLEVGTGSGYLTALLAAAGKHVYSVDIYPEFTNDAGRALAEHNVDNVTLETGDAAEGWDKHGPYDVIAITGSLPELTPAFDNFKRKLKVDGRLFVVVGEPPVMEALLLTRTGETDWKQQPLLETVIPPLVNAPHPRHFRF